MAPVALPLIKTEKFLLSGLGSVVLTEEQRASRSLTMTIEKVRPTNPAGVGQLIPAYFNNKWPEPQSHWGYWQLLQRDFVSSGGPLSYRREVIFSYEALWAEVAARLRCYLEKDHDFVAAAIETVLGGLPALPPANERPSINELKAVWELSLESQLFPTVPQTALWYELADGWKGQLTVTWQGFAPLNCGIEYQAAPPPKVPEKGESGDPGQRDDVPVPPGRASDPLSDLPSPPANSQSGPPVPEQVPPPPEGATRTRYMIVGTPWNDFSGSCNNVAVRLEAFSVQGVFPASAFSAQLRSSLGPGRCGAFAKTYDLRGPGGSGLLGYTENWVAGPTFVVEYQ